MKGFLVRTVSGICLVAALALFLYLGGTALWGALVVVSIIGQRELYNAIGFEKERLLTVIGYIVTLVLYVLLYLGAGPSGEFLVLVASLLVLFGIYVFSYPKYVPGQIMGGFFVTGYVPVMLSFIYLIRQEQFGLYMTLMIFICSWICDTCAYLSGMLLGKHKLAPVLSPKKTIEGAVGGVIGSVLVALLYSYVIGLFIPDMLNGIRYLLFGFMAFFGSIISQIGDLMASGIKRHYNIKDYGNLIPGHGGIMDRFDSVIVSAPVVYLVFLCVNNFM